MVLSPVENPCLNLYYTDDCKPVIFLSLLFTSCWYCSVKKLSLFHFLKIITDAWILVLNVVMKYHPYSFFMIKLSSLARKNPFKLVSVSFSYVSNIP